MKKLIVTAGLAIAAAATSLYGDEKPEAQVYDIKVTVKTMTAKRGKLSPKKNPFITDGNTSVIYRKQGTKIWKGLIWGCDCETIKGIWERLPGNSSVVSGVVIWDTKKPYDIILLDDMHWHVLNAVDQQGTKCECAWTIGESTDTSSAFLSFAGFGTLKLAADLVEENCGSHLDSVSGNVTGWMPAPRIETAGREAVCNFCGEVIEGEEGSVETAEAWNYCPCMDDGDRDFTAVSGTWSIKYNAKLSKKLSSSNEGILDVYQKFPATVKKAIEAKIDEVMDEGE